MKKFKLNKKSIIATLSISLAIGLFGPATLFAATAPVLGTNSTYGVVASTYTGTIAATPVTGDVCYTGAPPFHLPLQVAVAQSPCLVPVLQTEPPRAPHCQLLILKLVQILPLLRLPI